MYYLFCFSSFSLCFTSTIRTVSYTHLDVYKRQEQTRPLDSHIQRHRKKQGDQYSTRYRNAGIYQVIDKGNLEVFILKHLYVVAQSHEIKGFEPIIIGKGYDKPLSLIHI